MIKKGFLLFFIGIVFMGCQDKQKENYLNSIDRMQTRLDSLKEFVSQVNTDKINAISKIIDSTMMSISNQFGEDTINVQIARQIEKYKSISLALTTNSGNLAKVKSAIPEEQKKLKDLYHDISNGVNARDKYKEFVAFEKGQLQQIMKIWKYYTATNKKFISRFDSLQPIMKAFSNGLTNKNK